MKAGIPVLLFALSACAQPQGEDDTAEMPVSETPAATATTAEAAYDGPIPMPIRIGRDGPDFDACASYAEVGMLESAEDGVLYVHDAPSASTKSRDKLTPGQGVQVCDSADGWSGIVYPGEGQTAGDCGTGTPAATEETYIGPCRSGWVESGYLEMIAG